MHCGRKSATYKVVPDFHILLEVLGREIGMLVPHYSPPSTPLFTNLIPDFLHVGRVHQIMQLIRATQIIWQTKELINYPHVISHLFTPYKHRMTWSAFCCVCKELANHSHRSGFGVRENSCHPWLWITLWKSSTQAFSISISNPLSLILARRVTELWNLASVMNRDLLYSEEDDPLGGVFAIAFFGTFVFQQAKFSIKNQENYHLSSNFW